MKSGKYFKGNDTIEESKKIKCPYVKITGMLKEEEEEDEEELDIEDAHLIIHDEIINKDKDKDKKQPIKGNRNFEFTFPKDAIIIFDEAHRCKNFKSMTSKMLISMKNNNINKNKILLLSATIADKIICFKPFGVVFGFYNEVIYFKNWVRRLVGSIGPISTASQKDKIKSVMAQKNNRSVNFYGSALAPLSHGTNHNTNSSKGTIDDETILKIINNAIFPRYGSRIRIKELGNMFPQNQVTAQLYYCNNNDEINQQYDIIKAAFEEYKLKQTSSGFPLAIILYARMKIELYKIPIILDVANDALENGYSVVIFVCFKETLQQLAEQLNTTCLIYGGQTLEARNEEINRFQNNKINVMISMIAAGGVGISLHDLHGGHPRMSIINPSWNSIELKQALGRIHRAGAKTPALQRLIYCANTYEDKICEVVENKLKNIDMINNGEIDDEITKEMMQQQTNDEMNFVKISEEEAKKLQKEDTTLTKKKEITVTRRKKRAARGD